MATSPSTDTFKCQIDSDPPFSFPIVSAYRDAKYLRILGAQEEWEQKIENFEFNFSPTIKSGDYKLKDPGVFVDIRTGLVNIRYTPTSMTLRLTVDHSSKLVSGVFDVQTVEDYGGGSRPGIRVNGNFKATYKDV
ncbi:hypothetical protein [Pseudomonas costantinii]|uniref:hypothetical protein n=1 Tax=Pseudomonas costantinii TaxID=168469 RepID=UPI0015A0112F|nr:hypothetical protein [Pseudomonas costantinii]NVZ68915.1 hypothetical protein [Pseudomonas costantinii]